MTLKLVSKSYEETLALAAKIGRNLKGGEMIELVSDVGGGKTAFTTGLAKGAGSSDQVSSPSFTINQIYSTEKFMINHYDFYRLADPGLMQLELAETLTDPKSVTVIEWAETVADTLPHDRMRVSIETTGEFERSVVIDVPTPLEYLVRGVA